MHEANIINIELKDIHINIILFIDYLCYFISSHVIFIAKPFVQERSINLNQSFPMRN